MIFYYWRPWAKGIRGPPRQVPRHHRCRLHLSSSSGVQGHLVKSPASTSADSAAGTKGEVREKEVLQQQLRQQQEELARLQALRDQDQQEQRREVQEEVDRQQRLQDAERQEQGRLHQEEEARAQEVERQEQQRLREQEEAQTREAERQQQQQLRQQEVARVQDKARPAPGTAPASPSPTTASGPPAATPAGISRDKSSGEKTALQKTPPTLTASHPLRYAFHETFTTESETEEAWDHVVYLLQLLTPAGKPPRPYCGADWHKRRLERFDRLPMDTTGIVLGAYHRATTISNMAAIDPNPFGQHVAESPRRPPKRQPVHVGRRHTVLQQVVTRRNTVEHAPHCLGCARVIERAGRSGAAAAHACLSRACASM